MAESEVHVFVSGRVQGVAFRVSTQRCAEILGLSGFVRNLADGRVEAIFRGPEEAVRDALEFVRRGPRNARVEAVDVEPCPPQSGVPDGSGFHIR